MFPFPKGLSPNLKPENYSNPASSKIAAAAMHLNEYRENWLNPPEWTNRVPEAVAGYPDRVLPKKGFETELSKRTLTNLYNANPNWLIHAQAMLDIGVAEAYGWNDYTPVMSDDEIIRRLLALNLERTK